MELTVRNPVPASIMAPLNQKAVVAPAHVQVSQAQHVKKDESGNGNAVNGSQHSMASSSHQALPHDASSAPHDPLRYTVTEPTPAVKSELVDGQVANNASAAPTAGSSTSNASEDTKVAAEAKKEESDSESSDVSDDDDVDTSTWTNSLMSLYEDVRFTNYLPLLNFFFLVYTAVGVMQAFTNGFNFSAPN